MMHNRKIAEIFNEIADMIELEDEKRIFEVRAYQKAAMTLESMQEDVGDILEKKGIGGLMAIPGIGKGLADKIKEYVETGNISKHEELKKKFPIDFAGLTRIQGMGPKRIFKLYKTLGVRNVTDLKKAAEAGKVKGLGGFGKKSEEVIQKGIRMLESGKGRMLLGNALPEAESIIAKLSSSGLADRVELAGSARRMKETVGDLDILVISETPGKMMDFATGLPEVKEILLKGLTKTTVMLKIGITCDIRVLDKASFAAALQYFIGNKDHNVKVRQIAIRKGYKLSEYGLFNKKGKNIARDGDGDIYEKLGLQYMEPEMRENRGEVELAAEQKIPRLVQKEDILGDLHVHSIYSDGDNTIAEMAEKAAGMGREYIGITDHSRSEYVAKGMDEKKFKKYSREIDAVNEAMDGRIRLLKSAETDILKDGSLDFSRKALDSMDYVLGAIHSNLGMDKAAMTKRLITCIEGGVVDIMAHPTGRLINQRPPINLDLDKIFDAANKQGVVMEIDSYPNRLDLNDENILKAREYKLKFSIDTDSHRTEHLGLMRYGVSTAKRGWLQKDDVINALPYEKLLGMFKK